MELIFQVIAGLASIPKLIDRIDTFFAHLDQAKNAKLQQETIDFERKLALAETKEQVVELAKELHSLISRT